MKKSKTNQIKNENVKKRGTFTIVFAVLFVAVVILVNFFSTSLAQKLPTTIDLTADKTGTLTVENVDFIKSIENEVEIVVCAPRESYTGSDMVGYASTVYYVTENNTPDNYFNQTVNLIETYPKYNDKISVSYVDTQSPKFKELESTYEVEITYGDILVRCTRPDENGKEKTFESVITFEDIYELYDATNGQGSMYGSYSYTITNSNIETCLSSSIYTVAASEHKKVAVLAAHSTKDAEVPFTNSLKSYNYEIATIDGVVNESALQNVDTLLLVAPVSDLSSAELEVIDKFLDNDGKRGKNFLVFGSTASPATPNLNEFLEEWGIGVNNGIAYETSGAYRLSDGNSFILFNKGDKFTESINSGELLYYSSDIVSTSLLFETSGSRTAHLLMTTSPYAVTAPYGSKGYTPSSNDVLGEMPLAIVTEDTTYDSNYDEISSYVGYFASSNFISDAWEQFGDNGNMEFALCVANAMSGRDAGNMYFLPKITGYYTMDTPFTDAQYTAIYIIFIAVIPVIVLIGGVMVWFRRRNR